MNEMLASGGCPWAIIRVEDRKACVRSDSASIDLDIKPLCEFLAERARWSMKDS